MRSIQQLAIATLLAIAMTIALALLFGGCVPGLEPNPPEVSFDVRTYEVSYRDARGPCFVADDVTVRCFGRGEVLAHDFTGDGLVDLAMYLDERDGFRHTFAYLDIYTNDGTPLERAKPVQAKWKEGHWAWIDPATYPGLRADRFVDFMRDHD
ncbi:MAG: hypothetical protein HOV81_28300 [Kofleriaceae bacterium]|nr:hypothetical protein [Kofleriaceae bacterium]